MQQVIVIGPPRSGTSVVARLLQENLGVMMDEGPIRKDTHNPHGYYEDHRVVAINKIAISRWLMGKNHEQKVDPVWALQFAKWVAYMTTKYRDRQWGFKEPRCMGFISWVKQFFKDPIWIVCDRSDEQIIKSQVNKLGIKKEDAINGLLAYRKLIKDNLTDYHKIDLTMKQSEKKLTKRLKRILND